jgi:hypothetical protein
MRGKANKLASIAKAEESKYSLWKDGFKLLSDGYIQKLPEKSR